MTAAVLSSTSDSQSATLLQPAMTSPPPASANTNRASQRRSLMSTRSHTSRSRSRPTSSVFPLFPSSLSYALVRDFAYPQFHPLHYGSSPEPASRGSDTSAFSSSRRLSDPPPSWDGRAGTWSAGPWGGDGGVHYYQGDQLPSTSFDDDPSDDDVSGKLAKNHRKSKSYAEGFSRGRSATKRSERNQVPGLDSHGFFAPAADDDDGEEASDDDHPHNTNNPAGTLPSHRYAHSPSPMAEDLSARHHARLSALEPPFSDSSDPSDAPGGPLHHLHDGHEHRPTSTSLDESFAGPSLALYNFVPENSNELALREGQIIQVGYRHGQGWLVAMDLESGEQGLVPEEYVRLLSEIEGWGEGFEDDDMQSEHEGHSQTSELLAGSGEVRDTGALGVEPGGGGMSNNRPDAGTELAHRSKRDESSRGTA